jgi:hypothetical protein
MELINCSACFLFLIVSLEIINGGCLGKIFVISSATFSIPKP